MKQLTIKDPLLMQIAIQQEIQRSEESRYDHKLHGVLLIANNYDSYEVGEMFGQSPTTIQRWIKKFNESGFAGLRDGERSGRPRSLTDKQWDQLEKEVRQPPSDFKFTQSFWDGKLLSEHLRKRYKIQIGVRQCQRIFKMMGFRLRKPRPVIANADPLLQKGFKKLRLVLKNLANDIWYEDECHFQQHGTRCRMWIPPEEKDPIVKHAPTRKSMALFGAVSAKTGELITMDAAIFNAETFLLFLNKVLKSKKRGKKMILILDNARYHHATMIQPWLTKNKNKIQLLFLPPYSPDLNNIERVWKMTRRVCTHNRYFATLNELLNVVKRQLKIWNKPNETLRKLCCNN